MGPARLRYIGCIARACQELGMWSCNFIYFEAILALFPLSQSVTTEVAYSHNLNHQ